MRLMDTDIYMEKVRHEANAMPQEEGDNFIILSEWVAEKTSTIEPCKDTISRTDAIEQIVNTPTLNQNKKQEYLEGSATRQNEIIDILKSLPSVTPNRPIGKWIQLPSIYRPKEFACGFMCSLCKNPTYDRFRYCPNCGAEMDKESE